MKPETRDPKPENLDLEEEGPDCHHAANRATELGFNRLFSNCKPEILNPKPETQNLKSETRSPKPESLDLA